MNARRSRWIAVVAVLFLIAAGGAWWLTRHHAANGSRLVLYGNVDIRQAELAFNGSGRVDRLLVREGARIERGQLLARLDSRRLESALAQAQAQVVAQRAVVARLEAGSRPEEIRRARADVTVATVEANNAMHSYRRLQALVAQHFVAKQQEDNART
jgi:HlyD family secretion protein